MRIAYLRSPRNAHILTFESFRFDAKTKLLFFCNPNSIKRLCIPNKFVLEVLKIAYDNCAYISLHQTYDFLKDKVFMKKMWRITKSYVTSYPIYKMAKPKQAYPNGKLMPIPLLMR